MSGKSERAGADRRSFLKMTGLGAVAGGAALVTSKTAAKAAVEEPKKKGYRETDHVKTFYRTARF